jgi:hypothetical protein
MLVSHITRKLALAQCHSLNCSAFSNSTSFSTNAPFLFCSGIHVECTLHVLCSQSQPIADSQSLLSFSLWKSEKWSFYFGRALLSYFVECFSFWLWYFLMIREFMHLWQARHRNNAAFYSVHDLEGHAQLINFIHEDVDLDYLINMVPDRCLHYNVNCFPLYNKVHILGEKETAYTQLLKYLWREKQFLKWDPFLEQIQMIFDWRWFELQFSSFMMVQKQYSLSRNCTLNLNLVDCFSGLPISGMIFLCPE